MERVGRERIEQAVAALFPGARVLGFTPLGPDPSGAGIGRKEAGYGQPVRIAIEGPDGRARGLVLRTAGADEFGHDRRADRMAAMVLAFDTFAEVPDHVRALDVGVIGDDGLRSIRGGGEPYLVTTWAEGTLYAEDLRRIARTGEATGADLARSAALARWLARLHQERLVDPVAWRRAIRDLLGHGEGIFGIADAYPADVPGAPRARIDALEQRCLPWRWRLREHPERLRRTHGDFHPFNVVFGEGTRFTLLDASRGGRGDPADDVSALSVNYVFFGLQAPAAWPRGFGPLWRAFHAAYAAAGGPPAVRESLAPFLAWRALVLACPRFYPDLPAAARDALLGLAERALAAPAFEPEAAEDLFR